MSDFFNQNKSQFGLNQNDELILFRIDQDEIGYNHYRYQQFYKGIKVEGAEYIIS